jgi:hypothetical protein
VNTHGGNSSTASHIQQNFRQKKKKHIKKKIERERERESWDLGVGDEAVGGMVKRKRGGHWREPGEKSHCIWSSSLYFVISQVEFRRKGTLSTSLVHGRC